MRKFRWHRPGRPACGPGAGAGVAPGDRWSAGPDRRMGKSVSRQCASPRWPSPAGGVTWISGRRRLERSLLHDSARNAILYVTVGFDHGPAAVNVEHTNSMTSALSTGTQEDPITMTATLEQTTTSTESPADLLRREWA